MLRRWRRGKMLKSHWVEQAIGKGVLLGGPACALVLFVRRRLPGACEPSVNTVRVASLPALAVCVLYIESVLNTAFQGSVIYMVAWPLFGIGISLFGFGLVFAVPKGDRWRFVLADGLVLAPTFPPI